MRRSRGCGCRRLTRRRTARPRIERNRVLHPVLLRPSKPLRPCPGWSLAEHVRNQLVDGHLNATSVGHRKDHIHILDAFGSLPGGGRRSRSPKQAHFRRVAGQLGHQVYSHRADRVRSAHQPVHRSTCARQCSVFPVPRRPTPLRRGGLARPRTIHWCRSSRCPASWHTTEPRTIRGTSRRATRAWLRRSSVTRTRAPQVHGRLAATREEVPFVRTVARVIRRRGAGAHHRG